MDNSFQDERPKSVRTTSRKGIVVICVGLYLMWEATAFGALLKNEDAWVLYPLDGLLCVIASFTHCGYVFWIPYFSFPFISIGCLIVGIGMIIKANTEPTTGTTKSSNDTEAVD